MDNEMHTGASSDALKTALTAAYANTSANRVNAADGREYVIVPDGFDLSDITDPDRLRDFIAARPVFDAAGSLAGYVNRFTGPNSVLFADVDKGQVIARLDYHGRSDVPKDADATLGPPQQDRHLAVLQLRETEEFQQWSQFCGVGEDEPVFWDQGAFAAFLDENRVDVEEPDGAELLEIVKDLQTVQSSNFTGKVDLTNGDATFKFETDTQEVQRVKLPKTVRLRLAIYDGEDPVSIECALRWRASGSGGARLALVMRRIGRVKRELFGEVAARVAEATGLPLYFGRV